MFPQKYRNLAIVVAHRAKFCVHIHLFLYQLSKGVKRKYLCLSTILDIKIVAYINLFQAKIVFANTDQIYQNSVPPKLIIIEEYLVCFFFINFHISGCPT